jgi:hypothetical protein
MGGPLIDPTLPTPAPEARIAPPPAALGSRSSEENENDADPDLGHDSLVPWPALRPSATTRGLSFDSLGGLPTPMQTPSGSLMDMHSSPLGSPPKRRREDMEDFDVSLPHRPFLLPLFLNVSLSSCVIRAIRSSSARRLAACNCLRVGVDLRG